MRDGFLRACRGEAVRPVPVWFMRQAGRYLSAYQAVREKTDFLTLCKTPELAAEVTIQPVEILGVDAAILFSDILIPLEPMGIGLAFLEGSGPILTPAIRSEEAVAALRPVIPEKDLSFVLETIRILRRELVGKVPLIGFSGAPFTLATYLIEGGGSKAFVQTKRMMFEAPLLFHRLMDHLTEATIRYLSAQIEAGAQAVQVFDTWAGVLARQDYEAFVLPYMKRIFDALAGLNAPRISFVFNGGHLLDLVKEARADVIGLDWRTDIGKAVSWLGSEVVIQGNLDPCALFLPEKELIARVESIIRQGHKAKAHIFNLGHGILPVCPQEKARLLVDLVHELSAR